MSQIDQFLTALKRTLKVKNILYRDLAKSLGLSESSVKRILSNKSLSLDRLEEICRVADISFAEVCKAANFEENQQVVYMTDPQEKLLSENSRLLHLYILLEEGISVARIEKDYEISSQELQKYLLALDKVDLIELHPKNKIKVKHKGRVRFRRDGAVGKALFEQTKRSYLAHDFKNPEDFIRFSLMALSTSTVQKFKARFEKMLFELQEEAQIENEAGVQTEMIGLLIATRGWTYSFMNAIKKKA